MGARSSACKLEIAAEGDTKLGRQPLQGAAHGPQLARLRRGQGRLKIPASLPRDHGRRHVVVVLLLIERCGPSRRVPGRSACRAQHKAVDLDPAEAQLRTDALEVVEVAVPLL